MSPTSDTRTDEGADARERLRAPSGLGPLEGGPPVQWGVAALLVVAIAVLAVLSWQRWQDRGGDAIDDAPSDVAAEVAQDFFTLDHRSLDDDMDRVLAQATGEFETQYKSQSADLRKAVASKSLVLSASVPENGTAVEYVAADEAWVLVAVDVHTESGGASAGDTRYRTRIVLTRDDDGRWLASRFEQVG